MKRPKPTPAATGRPRLPRSTVAFSVRATSHTATSASAKPVSFSQPGNPCQNAPATTGTAALRTPDTGAATPMRPIASARYNAIRPTAPDRPAAPHAARFTAGGSGSRPVTASASKPRAPASCEPTTTEVTLTRLVARPPQKSPAPHEAADARPAAADARIRRTSLGRHGVTVRGRAERHAHLVRRAAVDVAEHDHCDL